MKRMSATFLFPTFRLDGFVRNYVKHNPGVAESCFELEAVDHPEYDGPGYDNACAAVLGPADEIMKLVGFIGTQGETNLYCVTECCIERCGDYTDIGE